MPVVRPDEGDHSSTVLNQGYSLGLLSVADATCQCRRMGRLAGILGPII